MIQTMPGFLYRSLPYLYAMAGLAALTVLQPPWGILSGVMLLVASAWVFYMRRVYRRARLGKEAFLRQSQAQRLDRGISLADRLDWHAELRCGHHDVDTSHRHLISLGKNFVLAAENGSPASDLVFFLETLYDDMSGHFQEEEVILNTLGKATAKTHRQAHSDLLAQFQSAIARFQSGRMETSEIKRFVVEELLLGHIKEHDLPCMAQAQPARH